MMQRFYKYAIATIISGVFLIVPVGILFIIMKKVIDVLKIILAALNMSFDKSTPFADLLNTLLVVLFVLLICFLCGIMARHQLGTRFVAWLEKNVLSHLPGYYYFKGTAEGVLGVSGEEAFREVVLFRHGDHFLLGFKVEVISAAAVAVFIPDVPRPDTGELFIVSSDDIITTDITHMEAMQLMRGIGKGASARLSKYFDKGFPAVEKKIKME
jgi:uncharacterized membrane protein